MRSNGDPAQKFDASTQSSTLGDAAGAAGGVRSGTVGGQVKPTGARASTSRAAARVARSKAARPTPNPDPPAKLKPAEQRAWYQKVGDWVGEQAHNAGQAVAHPVEGLKGAAKGIGNIAGDVWNLVAMGATAQAGGEMMNSAAMQSAFGGGSAADAEASMKLGEQMATTPGTSRRPCRRRSR